MWHYYCYFHFRPRLCIWVKHAIFGFFELVLFFSMSIFLQTHNFIPLYDWVILRCVYIPHFLYPFIACWTPRLMLHPGIVNSTVINMGMQVFLWYVDLHSFGYLPKSDIAGS
jgi:hypothetical protein